LTYALKNVHNFVGPLFAVSLFVIILTFIKDNIANRADFVWLAKGGGMLGKIAKLGETYLSVEVASGVEVQIQRAAVIQVLPKGTIK
jgi:cytochrome b subunit of formate dehydrogenase